MKIVVIGGTGLIGSRLVSILRGSGHEVLAASPDSGVNSITGEGLDAALAGAQVVVDVSNSPSFEDAAVLKFFETSTRNLLAAEERAGVRHHVILSIVGTDRVPTSGYLRAKLAQENLLKNSGRPYSILRSTQFFEFIGRIAQSAPGASSVRVSHALFQPILSADVVAALADITAGPPLNGTVEVGGPERFRMDELVRRVLRANGDPREVIADSHAPYFGAELNDDSLVASPGARVGSMRFEEWLKSTPPRPAA
ncbi:MAG TPA: SDR family oxidoreductase [Steroidobacteraceae bacterium]|nr:SDR family oxidoreductase [Steroidobacteraceae bacterium]